MDCASFDAGTADIFGITGGNRCISGKKKKQVGEMAEGKRGNKVDQR